MLADLIATSVVRANVRQLRSQKSVAIATLVLAAHGLAQDKPAQRVVQPGDNLVAEGMPAIPYSLVDDVRRYTESRSATSTVGIPRSAPC